MEGTKSLNRTSITTVESIISLRESAKYEDWLDIDRPLDPTQITYKEG